MSTEIIRHIRDGGRGYGCRGKGRLYTCCYTVTTRMTSALRWAAMRAILIFHNCEGQSHKTVSSDHNFWRERRAEADLNWSPSAYHPNALPWGQTELKTTGDIYQPCVHENEWCTMCSLGMSDASVDFLSAMPLLLLQLGSWLINLAIEVCRT